MEDVLGQSICNCVEFFEINNIRFGKDGLYMEYDGKFDVNLVEEVPKPDDLRFT